MKASENLDKGRLARAVIAQDAENLALSERQRHAVERGHGTESLDYIFPAQCLLRQRGHHNSPLRARRTTWMLKIIAARIAAPRIMLKVNALMPISVKPSFRMPSTAAPIRPPMIVPDPPASGVAAITAAATARNMI